MLLIGNSIARSPSALGPTIPIRLQKFLVEAIELNSGGGSIRNKVSVVRSFGSIAYPLLFQLESKTASWSNISEVYYL